MTKQCPTCGQPYAFDRDFGPQEIRLKKCIAPGCEVMLCEECEANGEALPCEGCNGLLCMEHAIKDKVGIVWCYSCPAEIAAAEYEYERREEEREREKEKEYLRRRTEEEYSQEYAHQQAEAQDEREHQAAHMPQAGGL